MSKWARQAYPAFDSVSKCPQESALKWMSRGEALSRSVMAKVKMRQCESEAAG